VASWPPPEVPENVNTDELGDLGLSKTEENLIATFMSTLSDGYLAPSSGPVVASAPILARPQVAPNPVGPQASIEYTLPVSGQVHLRIFDVAGRQVATVVDDVQAAGRHGVRFVTNALPSGVYFVRLDTAGTTSTTRAVLIH
jgi:hypothetical protein